jgi:hypothetical protein
MPEPKIKKGRSKKVSAPKGTTEKVDGKNVKMIETAEKRVELPQAKEVKMLENKKNKNKVSSVGSKIQTRDKKIIEKELFEIYKDPNGEIPDMSKIYHKKKSRAKRTLIGLVAFFAFLAALSWAGFFFFGQGRNFSGDKVTLEIITPATVAGGDMVEYTIKYKNGEGVPLGQAEIQAKMPETFVLSETVPAPSEGENLWRLGSLSAGKEGEIKVRGILRGAIDNLEAFQAVLTYKPADFNSEFQKVATAVMKIDHSVLDLELSGPSRILTKSEALFKIKYKNTAAISLQNVRISVPAPQGFSFKEKADEAGALNWDLAEILPSEEKEIEFHGSFGEAVEGEKEIKVEIGFVSGDKFYLQKESVFKTNVLAGAMVVTLVANGDSKDRTINFGDTLNYSIAYQNKDKADLSEIEIKMVFESTSRNNKMILDWATLKDDEDGVVLGTQLSPEVRQGTITWTKRQVPALAKLVPGAEGMINFQIKLKPFSEFQGWDTKDFEIKSLVAVKIGKMGSETGEETISSNTINLKVNTNLGFQTEARYFNDDNIAVGSGPLPPRAGEVTAYRIFWTVTNSLHEIENLRVSTVLPENINWSNKYEITAGELKFNEATREVAWTLNRMPLDVQSLGTNFEVTVTPTAAEKGKLLTLLLGTNLTATDKSTGGIITKVTDALTSNLLGDPAAEGKGIVR